MENKKIIANIIKCNHCGDIIESENTHDFKWCKCGKVAVDGGKEYLKRSFQETDDFLELSLFREQEQEIIIPEKRTLKFGTDDFYLMGGEEAYIFSNEETQEYIDKVIHKIKKENHDRYSISSGNTMVIGEKDELNDIEIIVCKNYYTGTLFNEQ